MIRLTTPMVVALGVLLTPPALPSAFANGAAFFNDPGQVNENGTLYFGIVKDQKGAPIVDATVHIQIQGQNIEYVYQTTTLGRYRSIDLPKDTDPKLVQVTVEKKGFRIVTEDNRTRTIKAGLPVEINFVVTAATG